jgi:hypothetical protein
MNEPKEKSLEEFNEMEIYLIYYSQIEYLRILRHWQGHICRPQMSIEDYHTFEKEINHNIKLILLQLPRFGINPFLEQGNYSKAFGEWNVKGINWVNSLSDIQYNELCKLIKEDKDISSFYKSYMERK